MPPGLAPVVEPLSGGDLPEVEIIVGDPSKFESTTPSTTMGSTEADDSTGPYKSKVSTSVFEVIDGLLLCVEADIRRPRYFSVTKDALRDGEDLREVPGGSCSLLEGGLYPCLSKCASKGRRTIESIPNRVHEATL